MEAREERLPGHRLQCGDGGPSPSSRRGLPHRWRADGPGRRLFRLKGTRPHPAAPLALSAALCLLVAGCGQPPSFPPPDQSFAVDVNLSTNVVRIGDPCTLTVRTVHPTAAEVRLPAVASGKAVVVRDEDVSREPLDDQRTMTTHKLSLTSFEVGEHVLFTNLLRCVQDDGAVLEKELPDTVLTVESVLQDPEEPLRPAKALARWQRSVPVWVWAFLVVAVAAVAAALLVRRIMNKPRTILHFPPPTPPHEAALEALRILRGRKWIEEGNVEPFYVELSRIVRTYIEGRFGLHAPEQTTEEFIRAASTSHALAAEHQSLTVRFLEQSDLVKFARHRPGRPDMEAALAAGEQLVRETLETEKPADTAPPGQGGSA